MYPDKNIPNSIFARSHRTLTWGTVLFGGMLLFLSILIFAYPALIAYFIAAVILFIGLSVLAMGWKLWQVRNEIKKLDNIDYETYRPGRNHFTFIRW
ncbi:MAG: hypothetical protein HOK41_09280 [Nitrospina sp.]|jgi:uncharacterized integral membrane protein|nr:hypothetical protein [Nitrospina sp.]MBT6717540.1 hypothetical protein [Nitrospina sp.]